MDCGDKAYDKPNNSRVIQRVPLSRIGISISTWQMQIWKTYLLYKIVRSLSLQYLTKYLRLTIMLLMIKLELQIKTTLRNFLTEEKASSTLFFICVREWKNLESPIREAKSIKRFKSMLMQFFVLFLIHDQISIKLLTRLWLKFCHLHERKFHHKFKYCVSHMCNCGVEIEIT